MFWQRFKKDRAAVIGLIILTSIFSLAIFGDIIAPYDPVEQNLVIRRQLPSREHIFGNDIYGRDIFSRILVGAKTTLTAGITVVIISMIIGTLLGSFAGYWGGLVNTIIMRGMDFILAFPTFFLAILIVAMLGPNLTNAIVAVVITSVPQYARVTCGSTLSIKNNLYIEAARAMGASDGRIIFEHIIPNLIGTIIVLMSVGLGGAVLLVAALGFLGLGAQPPSAEWGLMLSEGRSFIASFPHITIIPGIFLAIFVLSTNLVGDGLRDALDPRLK